MYFLTTHCDAHSCNAFSAAELGEAGGKTSHFLILPERLLLISGTVLIAGQARNVNYTLHMEQAQQQHCAHQTRATQVLESRRQSGR